MENRAKNSACVRAYWRKIGNTVVIDVCGGALRWVLYGTTTKLWTLTNHQNQPDGASKRTACVYAGAGNMWFSKASQPTLPPYAA